jgi:hypothetical protein
MSLPDETVPTTPLVVFKIPVNVLLSIVFPSVPENKTCSPSTDEATPITSPPNSAILISPLPSNEVLLIVLMSVPDSTGVMIVPSPLSTPVSLVSSATLILPIGFVKAILLSPYPIDFFLLKFLLLKLPFLIYRNLLQWL